MNIGSFRPQKNNDPMKILIIPQSGFSKENKRLFTVKNRGEFYVELTAKFKVSTILYTIAKTPHHDNKFNISNHNTNFVCLKDHREKNIFGLGLNYLKTIVRIIKLIRCHDVLVVFIPNKTATLAVLVGWIFNKKVVTYVGGDWQKIALIPYKKKEYNRFTRYIKYVFNTIFEYVSVRLATFVFVAGRELLKNLEKYNASISEAIPMIEFKKSDIVVKDDTFQSQKINILYVGYLTKLKGIKYLIEGFLKIREYYPNSILHIVGDGELYTDLEKKSYANVILHGHLNRKEELRKLYMLADVFIFPSLSEGFPRVLYEAMIHSIPIITTNVGGIKYFLEDRIDALLIPAKSSDQIYEKYCLLANDKALRQKIISNSHKKIHAVLRYKASDQFFEKIRDLSVVNNIAR